MMDIVIKGGRVVTPDGDAELDVGISGEKIVAISAPNQLPTDGARVLDVQGKIVVPGGIEPHAHIGPRPEAPDQAVASQAGAAETTRGVVFGGVTTIFDFCTQRSGVGVMQAIEERSEVWKGQSYIDYSFHITLRGDFPSSVLGEIPEAIQEGFTSTKTFITDHTPIGLSMFARLSIGELWAVFQAVHRAGGVAMVHSEDYDIVSYMYRTMKEDGTRAGKANNHPLIHSGLSEDISFRRVIRLAEHTETAVYFVHTVGRYGVAALTEARTNGLPIYGEVLHTYLCFTSEDYKDPEAYKTDRRWMDGNNFPGMQYPDDRESLWTGILGSALSTTGTDQGCVPLKDKLAQQTAESWGGGHNGAESRMGVVFTEGVVKRGMSLGRFVDVTSANAARIFGLYPRKGAIAVGSDADIAIIDPGIHKTLTMKDLHLGEYSVWEGQEVQGWPVTTILRGKIVVEKGKLLAKQGYGQLLKRKVDPSVLTRPAA